MLASATDVAAAVGTGLRANSPPDAVAAAAYRALWSQQNRGQRDFQAYGGDFLMEQHVELLRGFFIAFFAIDNEVLVIATHTVFLPFLAVVSLPPFPRSLSSCACSLLCSSCAITQVWGGFLAGWPGLPGNVHHETWNRRLVFALSLFLKMNNKVLQPPPQGRERGPGLERCFSSSIPHEHRAPRPLPPSSPRSASP
jgi:lycopene beta-cyclase